MTDPASAAPGPVAERIRAKLTEAFAPAALAIDDESEQHRHHSGFREGGETHFHVSISAAPFAEMSRLERHRAVNEVLRDELSGPVHALRLTISAPSEP